MEEISNDKCILVEFVNEGNKVGVGYSQWCGVSDDAIEKIIEKGETVMVRWPTDCEVVSATYMKKKLKSCTFKDYPAKISAQGGIIAHLY